MFEIVWKILKTGIATRDLASALEPQAFGSLQYAASLCQQCGACEKQCPAAAISRNAASGEFLVSYGDCIFCRRCAEVCPSGALQTSNRLQGAVKKKVGLSQCLSAD